MLLTPAGKPDVTARYVLACVAERADKNGRNAHPSIADIRYRTGMDRSTVQRALRRLEMGELLQRDGSVGGCTRWILAMDVKRPASDWKAIEADEEAGRAAVAERVRRHRAKAVTHSEAVTETGATPVTDADVTHSEFVTEAVVTNPESVTTADVTHPEGVTEPDVTHSAPVSNAPNARYEADVTHSTPVCNALNTARTIHEPSEVLTVLEPSSSENPPPSDFPPGAETETSQTTIDGQPPDPPKPKRGRPGKAKVERTPEQQAAYDAATQLAKWWWDAACPDLGITVTGKDKFPGFVSFLERFLLAKPNPCSPTEAREALEACRESWPQKTRFEKAIRDLRGKAPQRSGRPTNQHHEASAGTQLAKVFEA